MFKLVSNFIKEDYIENLINEIPFNKDYIFINDKKILENRFTYWMSDLNKSYKYGGKIMKPNRISDTIKIIQKKIKDSFDIYFDSVLINFYENGCIGMKYHSDETYNEWSEESIIVSFGDERKVIFRSIKDYEQKVEYICKNGDLIFMKEGCQSNYQHKVCKKKLGKERISLVFKRSLT